MAGDKSFALTHVYADNGKPIPFSGVRGQTLFFDGSFTDPGFDNPLNTDPATGGEQYETFTYRVEWGDGTSDATGIPVIDTAGGPGVLTAGSFETAHIYTAEGIYEVLPADRRPMRFRFLEKTPKNALRISFLHALFPDAQFIYLHRGARESISSILVGWKSGRFVTYPDLPGWHGPKWSFLLPMGRRELNGHRLVEVAAFQWRATNARILEDLSRLPDSQWTSVRYEQFVEDPAARLKALCEFVQVPFGPRMEQHVQGGSPLSRYTLEPPDPDKWRRNEKEIEAIWEQVQQLDDHLDGLTVGKA